MAEVAEGDTACAIDPTEKLGADEVLSLSVATGCHATDLVAPGASYCIDLGCGGET